MTVVQQYGLPRSGTNLAKWILEKNYDIEVLTNQHGWKHGAYNLPNQTEERIPLVVCVRDPFSWLAAYWRWVRGFVPHKTFVDFIYQSGPGRGRLEQWAVHLWSFANRYWLSIGAAEIGYDRLLVDPEEECDMALLELIGLTHRKPEKVFETPKKNVSGGAITRPTDELRAYELEKKYLNEWWTEELIAFVAKRLDMKLMGVLGYEVPTL